MPRSVGRTPSAEDETYRVRHHLRRRRVGLPHIGCGLFHLRHLTSWSATPLQFVIKNAVNRQKGVLSVLSVLSSIQSTLLYLTEHLGVVGQLPHYRGVAVSEA